MDKGISGSAAARFKTSLTATELDLLAAVPQAIMNGEELYSWWLQAEAEKRIRPIPAVRQLNRLDFNYGFLDEIPMTSGVLPVLGVVQDMFYDRPKVPASHTHTGAEWYRAQVEEYALRYFMRTSWFPSPEIAAQPLAAGSGIGWRFSQLFYKLKETGEIGRFAAADRYKIIDLREIGKKYEWIVTHVRMLDFTMELGLPSLPELKLDMPVHEEVFAVLNRDFVINRDHPEPGVLGEYGFLTPVIPVPQPDSILAYGPSALVSAFQLYSFRVLDSGEVRAKAVLLGNRPTRILKLEPLDWSFQLADLLSFGQASRLLAPVKDVLSRVSVPQISPLFTFIGLANSSTGGLAERQFCISYTRLYTWIMATHFMAIYNFLLQTLMTWEQVPNWLDTENLPAWATGEAPPR